MCRQLGLPRATYYRRLDAGDTPTALRRRELTDQVKTVFDSSDGIFGHRMVHAKLAAAGIEVSVGTVAGIMAENGWAAKRMRAFKRTTIASDPDKVFEDLIGRDFTAEALERVWWAILPTCAPAKGGCIWPLSLTCAPAWSSAGPWLSTCAPRWLPEP